MGAKNGIRGTACRIQKGAYVLRDGDISLAHGTALSERLNLPPYTLIDVLRLRLVSVMQDDRIHTFSDLLAFKSTMLSYGFCVICSSKPVTFGERCNTKVGRDHAPIDCPGLYGTIDVPGWGNTVRQQKHDSATITSPFSWAVAEPSPVSSITLRSS